MLPGILLYTLLTGYPPFRGEDQICEGQLRFPEYISQGSHHKIFEALTTFL
jgi:hypothetical protein